MVGSVENSQVMMLKCDLEKITMVKVLKFGTLFSFFSQKNVVYQVWNSKKACQNSKQKQSHLGLFCLSWPF